jgi:hypothetical protein
LTTRKAARGGELQQLRIAEASSSPSRTGANFLHDGVAIRDHHAARSIRSLYLAGLDVECAEHAGHLGLHLDLPARHDRTGRDRLLGDVGDLGLFSLVNDRLGLRLLVEVDERARR